MNVEDALFLAAQIDPLTCATMGKAIISLASEVMQLREAVPYAYEVIAPDGHNLGLFLAPINVEYWSDKLHHVVRPLYTAPAL